MSRADTLDTLVRYEDDYNAWVLQQISLLKTGRIPDVDVPHLIEELRDFGNSEPDQIESRIGPALVRFPGNMSLFRLSGGRTRLLPGPPGVPD
jgi:hypothetical protein